MSKEFDRSREERSVQPPTDSGGGSRNHLRRRGVLKTLGVAGTAALGSWGAVGTAAARSEDDDETVDTSESSFPPGAVVRGATIESLRERGWDIVDVVEAGVDNTGETPVEDEIADLLEEDTVLVFPDGEYLFQGSVTDLDIDHVAFMGEPGATPQLVVGEEFRASERDFPNYSVFVLGFGSGGSGLVFRDFEINMEGEGIGAGGIQVGIKGDGGYIKNIDFVGVNDSIRGNIATNIPDEDAVLSVHDVRMPDGASRAFGVPSYDDSVGIIATKLCTGDLHLGNCVVGGFPNNGVYASKVGIDDQPGKVIVRGGRFFNSDRDQLRVGAQSEIHYAYCYSDEIKPGFNNLRGVWVRHADDVLIENTRIEQMTSDSGAGIRISNVSGKTTVRNTSIRLDSPGYGIWGITPAPPTGGGFARPPGSETEVVCENVSITGSVPGREAVRIEDRDGSRLEDICIELTAGNRDGLVFQGSDATVRNALIDVTGEQIVAENSTLETEDIRNDGDCPAQLEDGDDFSFDDDKDEEDEDDDEGEEEESSDD